MENDFRGLEDLIKNVVQESDCPFSSSGHGIPPKILVGQQQMR
jgi:hypothetical protein